MNYSQKDPRWSGLKLGSSTLSVGGYGCLTTIHSIAFSLAGYTVTPDELCVRKELYTTKNYLESAPGKGDGQAGLWWWNLGKYYPQFRYGEGPYQFTQVIARYDTGRFEHWVLKVGDTYYDPIDGTSGPLKSNYSPTTKVKLASIDPAPVPTGQVTADVPVTVKYDPQKRVTVQGTQGKGLNCRTYATSHDVDGKSTFFKLLPENSTYWVKGLVHGENVEGNDKWYITANGHYMSAYFTSQPF